LLPSIEAVQNPGGHPVKYAEMDFVPGRARTRRLAHGTALPAAEVLRPVNLTADTMWAA